MKAYRKIMFVMLLALVAGFALSVFAGSASAALSYQGSISTDNQGVTEEASYTLTLANTGTDRLLSVNITVPSGFTDIKNLVVVTPSSWTVHDTLIDDTLYLNLQSTEGLASGTQVTVKFDATNPREARDYTWIVNATGTDGTHDSTFDVEVISPIRITTMVPALTILGIAVGFALLYSVLNRVLITYFVGWDQHHVMRREIAEFQRAQMAAARANDQKQMEKLKRKQTQINSMQAKMMKPQLLQLGASFIQFGFWFLVLTPTFGGTSLAFLPGFGAIPVFWLYPAISMFLSITLSRIIGTMPIDI